MTQGASFSPPQGAITMEDLTASLASLDIPAEGTLRDRDMGTARYTEALKEIDALPLTEILDFDSRPTFILDLDPDLDAPVKQDVLMPIFCNHALRTYDRLLEVVGGETIPEALEGEEGTYQDFISWSKSVTRHDDSMDIFPLSFLYGGMLWTGSTISKRWRLISGNKCYKTSSVTAGDLSSGPPSEVATGGLAGEMSDLTSSANEMQVRHKRRQLTPNQRKKMMPMSNSSISKELIEKPNRTSEHQVSSWSSLDYDSAPSVILDIPEFGCPDWTIPDPRGVLTAHVQLVRSIDWAATTLGPMSSWSAEFRQMVNLLMIHPHPAALFWGNDMTVIYNEAYRDGVAGRKHPDLLGTGFRGPFAELWEEVSPIFAECARTGQAIAMENQMLPIERHGFLEETYFTWSCTPIYGGTSRILGFYNAPFETTTEQIGNRRMKTLRTLGEKVALARTVKEFWARVLEGLDENHFDVPFALLYSVIDVDDGESSSHSSSGSSMSMKSCVFEGGLGIPKGHPAAPLQLDLKRSREGFIPSFREAMRTRSPTQLQTRDSTLPEFLLEGIEWRGFEEPCREAIICPVRPTTGENVLGFLLLGVNPRRPYDDEYRSFMDMLNRQLATSLASTILYEEETRRGRTAAEAAALEQEQLNDQLAIQTTRLQRMTERSPTGLFYISPEGILLEGNDRWFELTDHPRIDYAKYSWLDLLRPDFVPMIEKVWENLVLKGEPWTGEIALKKKWHNPVTEDEDDFWILGEAHPEYAPDGTLRSVMGSLTDINHLKWAERLQSQRLQEAEETRRQQNEFIDITSHEMRNPLSAILQCADDIAESLAQYHLEGSRTTVIPAAVLENCIDAANTIVLCAQHQKCIVDDILTISKLDSNLLLITPMVVQPVAVAQRAVKMFDAELQKKNIELKFVLHDSITELKVDWAVLDPSRLLQVLINLITNAIKFTQGQSKRLVTVRFAASLEAPVSDAQGFEYIPTKSGRTSLSTTSEHWGSGEVLYLQFEVQDTGRGLTVDEKQLLFQRFSQASPRTHAQYGGSGLGLFISRQLTELHGGQIGVMSEAGVGSTFAFYIRAKRSLSSDHEGHLSMEAAIGKSEWQGQSYVSQMVQSGDPYLNTPLSHSHRGMSGSPSMKAGGNYHVLVVEDNLVNQRVMCKQLEKAGCTVNVASHGEEALSYLATTRFFRSSSSLLDGADGAASPASPSSENPGGASRVGGHDLSVILMDLEMPVMDGLTCVKRIREWEAEGVLSGRIPVIAVTANVRTEQIRAAREAGMDDVVSKPFRIPQLLAKIGGLLAKPKPMGEGKGEGKGEGRENEVVVGA